MARTITCDRCGALVNGEQNLYVAQVGPYKRRRQIATVIPHDVERTIKVEVCRACADEILDYMSRRFTR